jgi:hypothetical protein
VLERRKSAWYQTDREGISYYITRITTYTLSRSGRLTPRLSASDKFTVAPPSSPDSQAAAFDAFAERLTRIFILPACTVP